MKITLDRTPYTLKIRLSLLMLVLMMCADSAFSQAGSPHLLTTLTNPTPAASDIFGGAVAGMDNDRVLVGAEGAAEAYLFRLDGTLMVTFPIPDPLSGSFGAAVTAVGSDRVLIGAYNYTAGVPVTQAGRAYLYGTNGVLLTTFTNPSPATVQAFGYSVAGVGRDMVLIGAGTGGPFLFQTNGSLLTTFIKPTAGAFENFGTSLAAIGSDRVLIGASSDATGAPGAGAAYLFRTNGILLTTFTNPIPVAGDNFGTSVAAVGTDRLLISAIAYGGGASGGAAYLFSTNGTLLTTITNPTPEAYDYFGWSVAAVGSSRVLVGAYQDGAGAFQAGSAYLFSTNGTLLNTITNPTPARQDWFSWSVAAVGSDRVVIGGVWDDTGATDAGSAYLFALPYPPLKIARDVATVSVSWVTAETGLILQQTGVLGPAAQWTDTTNVVSVNNLTNAVQQTIPNGPSTRFYRLRRP